MIDWDKLRERAEEAQAHAHAPYSKFRVGAALEAQDGTVYTGANVENASYGLCLCAERSAIAAAVVKGQRQFARIAIVADSDRAVPPCGMCRQVLAEFSQDLVVRTYAADGTFVEHTVSELLPFGFDASFLGQEAEEK